MCVRDALTEQGVERRRVESGRVWMGAWKMIRGVQIVDRPFKHRFHIASLAAHRSSSPQSLSHIACRHVAAEDVLLACETFFRSASLIPSTISRIESPSISSDIRSLNIDTNSSLDTGTSSQHVRARPEDEHIGSLLNTRQLGTVLAQRHKFLPGITTTATLRKPNS